ncbi:MAG: 50S ribosomal protein L11 methyltransferase [Phycisphaerae bacterium]|nr:50S ribosomal protein L11 methyltransferase [Phycisphaerae bacterium]
MSGVVVRCMRFGAIDVRIETPGDADAVVREAELSGSAERGYWAHLWPAAVMLAGYVARTGLVTRGTRVLEIGCGVGLVGIVAALRGAEVVLTDYCDEAVAAAARNATLNGVDAAARKFDWRDEPDPAWDPGVLLGADVLYFEESHGAIARLIARLGCVAILGYPNRPATAEAAGVFGEEGLRVWGAAAESGRVLLAQAR